MREAIFAEGQLTEPWLTFAVGVVTLILGAVISFLSREVSARTDRRFRLADEKQKREQDRLDEMSRWARGERRALYARFIAANDAAFNAAASVKGSNSGDSTHILPSAARISIEHAQGELITALAEVLLLAGEEVRLKAVELQGFHQQMVRHAIEIGGQLEGANETSNRLTQEFIAAARTELEP